MKRRIKFMRIIVIIACIISVIGTMGYLVPKYSVYAARLHGEAKLAHAVAEREVQVRDAQGKLEAATFLAKAEVERAKGVAEANRIIGTSLQNNEAYLRWLYIDVLKETKGQVIYIPTEAGLPLLEATRKVTH